LITEHDSGVTILLADKSALALTGRSKMLLDRSFYHVDSRTEKRNTKLQLLFGKVRSFVSRITGDSDYTITTPTAVAGVRGTDFALVVGPVWRKPSECETFSRPRSSVSASESEEFITSLLTVLVTGENHSNVEFADTDGRSPIIVDSLSMTGIMSGCTGTEPAYLGRNALGILEDIGPEINRLQDILTAQRRQQSEFLPDPLRRDMEDLIRIPVSPVRP
jgi:hypothetical protein